MTVESLLRPTRLHSAEGVLQRVCPIPASSGVYAWYFRPAPPGVPTAGCHELDGWTLLYVGISPKAPPANGGPASRQTIRKRIRSHFRGNASVSTLRLTLGCLLSESLGIELRRVGSTDRLTFGPQGERRLSEWMAGHARVAWVTTAQPWMVEKELIGSLAPPLNLDQNVNSAFRQLLAETRAEHRRKARSPLS